MARAERKVACVENCGNLAGRYSSVSGRCRSCAYKARRKTAPRIWKTGYVYNEHGKRPRPEHVVIAERVLGRPLKAKEHVHHIDLDRSNNTNSNLLICSAAYHKWLHWAYEKAFVRRVLCPQ